MTRVEWTCNDFVYAPGLDSDHRKLFEQVEKVRRAVEHGNATHQAGLDLWRLSRMAAVHCASEERLMQESRYPAAKWHKRQHKAGRTKLDRLVAAEQASDRKRMDGALEDFARWMKHHVHLADRMFAAHLRNDQRGRSVS